MHLKRPRTRTRTILKWSLVATVAYVVLETMAGVQARSLALLSDAGHNFTDALALLVAWFGSFLETKPADAVKTYGYRRAGVLAAFLNALGLLALALYILHESYRRFLRPQPVDEWIMLAVAGSGVILNVAIMYWMRHDRRHDLNVRSAWLHMFGDALSSLGIIVGAILIHLTGWSRIDPILSALVAGLILWTAWDIIRESLNILLEGVPRGIDLTSVAQAICQVEGVCGVHDLHIWSLGSNIHALSCHVLIDDLPPSESQAILHRINRLLCERYHIQHTTIQFEHVHCPISRNGCSVTSFGPASGTSP